MSQPPEIVHGGNWQVVVGCALSGWQWFAGDANGATVLLTIASLILAIIKIMDAARRWAWADEFIGANRPLMKKICDAVTRPSRLDDERK